MQSMTLETYFKVIKPTYIYLRLIPDSSIRNYSSSNIAKMVANMYVSISRRIYKREKTYCFKTPVRCSYFIDIRKNDMSFYFVVPDQYETIAREKITATWPRVTIDKYDSIEEFSGERVAYQLSYTKEDALSLDTDCRSNALLGSILNVADVMAEVDRIGIFYNFVPTDQKYWRGDYSYAMDKWKERKPMDRNKLSPMFILKYGGIILLSIMESILSAFGDMGKNDDNAFTRLADSLNNTRLELSDQTKRKKDELILNTQIAVMSSSNTIEAATNNAVTVCQSFDAIEGDNRLNYKKCKKIDRLTGDYVYLEAETNKMSVSECGNLIRLPGRELMEKYKMEHVNTLETEIEEELRKGVMCVGTNTYKGITQQAYLSDDFAFKFLTLCIIGPTRAGKSTLISNLCLDSLKAGEVNIVFDWCGKCGLTDDIRAALCKQSGIEMLTIDCSNITTLQGLGYNELYVNTNDVFERYRSAKAQASQLMTLVNSLQGEGTDLQARMERYLEAASIIVFINNGPIRDVMAVLQRDKERIDYIRKIADNQKENTQEYVEALEELNEYDKKTGEVIGTKISSVQGILNRMNKLKQNTYMELMLKRDCKNNFDLTEEIQKPQLICIKMPDNMFSTETEKDIYATYWLTKLWAALQQRLWKTKNENDLLKVNMYFDELYQTPNCQEFLKSKLSQIAKFHAKPIISCHYLGQISGIRGELKAANTSYMLIAGCDKMNYNELKEELDPYVLDDLLHLKRYHSLNLIKTSDGYARFITQLPKPIN